MGNQRILQDKRLTDFQDTKEAVIENYLRPYSVPKGLKSDFRKKEEQVRLKAR